MHLIDFTAFIYLAHCVLSKEVNPATGGNTLRWIETIRIQVAAGKETAAREQLTVLVHEIEELVRTGALESITASRNALVPEYFALRLFWNTGEPHRWGSTLGVIVAHSMKEFGLIDHSLWIEEREPEGGTDHERDVPEETAFCEY